MLIACIESEVGRPDEYGDYPMASGIALVFVAAVTILGLAGLDRGGRLLSADKGAG